MRLVTFDSGHEDRVGAVVSDWVVDIAETIHLLEAGQVRHGEVSREALEVLTRARPEVGTPLPDMIALLRLGSVWLTALDKVLPSLVKIRDPEASPQGLVRPLTSAHLRAPVAKPGKIVLVGLNYESHAREQGREPPSRPVFFLKSSNTVCGPGDPIVLPPNSDQVDFEAEFAVVIGKRGKQIPEDRVYEHIAGYLILNDVSARDMQFGDRQYFRAKSCDTFAPMGPWIVTTNEISDPHQLRISLTLNGKTMQDSNTRDLIFKIPYLVSYLSQSLTWDVGDVLSTGTPGGVGHFRKPPVYLKPGDSVSITVEGVGTLTNDVSRA